jgi:hypothetical protein
MREINGLFDANPPLPEKMLAMQQEQNNNPVAEDRPQLGRSESKIQIRDEEVNKVKPEQNKIEMEAQ